MPDSAKPARPKKRLRRGGVKITPEERAVFLDAFGKIGTVTGAARVAGVDSRRHYEWLASSPDYARQFADAEDRAAEQLEQEARRRAVVGVDEPVYHLGKIVGYTRKHSDVLLIFLLKGARPEKYRERYEAKMTGGLEIKSRAEAVKVLADAMGATEADVEKMAARLVAQGGVNPQLPAVH